MSSTSFVWSRTKLFECRMFINIGVTWRSSVKYSNGRSAFTCNIENKKKDVYKFSHFYQYFNTYPRLMNIHVGYLSLGVRKSWDIKKRKTIMNKKKRRMIKRICTFRKKSYFHFLFPSYQTNGRLYNERPEFFSNSAYNSFVNCWTSSYVTWIKKKKNEEISLNISINS